MRRFALSALLVAGILAGCTSNDQSEPRGRAVDTFDVTEATFAAEVLHAEGLVLLDFWAEWCVPCHEIDPVLERLAPDYAGEVKVCRINVDDNPELVIEYVPDNIFPCLILMRDGVLLDRRYGTDPRMEIEPFFRDWFDTHLLSR